MKIKLAAAILIDVVVFATISLAQQSSPVADPEAVRILDRAAQAEGGDDVLGALRTLRLTGSTYAGSYRASDFDSIIKFPDKFRDSFLSTGGRTVRYGFDGTEAWKQLAGATSSGLPSLQLLLPAAQWRLRYSEAKFLGQREIGNRRAYLIRALVHGQTLSADYYYDPDTYLLLQVDSGSERLPIIYRVSHFQVFDGLKVPREWSSGENRTAVVSIKLNVEIDDKQFAKPK